MDGFYIRQKGEYLQKIEKKNETLSLLANNNNMEIMIHNVQPNRLYIICPGDNDDLLEFFYILKGSLYLQDENITLKEGDYIYTNQLKDVVQFNVIEETSILYASSNPVFECTSNKINDLINIAKKVEKKDAYTHGHNLRLQEYAIKIGKKLGLPKRHIENLFYSSIFHDIGKIDIPDEILNKPGKLTNEEFDCIKKHSTYGKILADENKLDPIIGTIIEQHHERLDGSGYPYKLKAEDILLEAKIIAIVDTYDAITSDRPYRKGAPSEEALAELRRLSGIHYDPNLIDVFESIINEEK